MFIRVNPINNLVTEQNKKRDEEIITTHNLKFKCNWIGFAQCLGKRERKLVSVSVQLRLAISHDKHDNLCSVESFTGCSEKFWTNQEVISGGGGEFKKRCTHSHTHWHACKLNLNFLTIYGPNVRRQRCCGVHPTQAKRIDSLQHGIVVGVTAAVLGTDGREIEMWSATSGTWILETININVTVWLWVMRRVIGICIGMVMVMVIGAGRLHIGHGGHAARSLTGVVCRFYGTQEIETRWIITSWNDIAAGRVGECSGTLISICAGFGSHLFLSFFLFFTSLNNNNQRFFFFFLFTFLIKSQKNRLRGCNQRTQHNITILALEWTLLFISLLLIMVLLADYLQTFVFVFTIFFLFLIDLKIFFLSDKKSRIIPVSCTQNANRVSYKGRSTVHDVIKVVLSHFYFCYDFILTIFHFVRADILVFHYELIRTMFFIRTTFFVSRLKL